MDSVTSVQPVQPKPQTLSPRKNEGAHLGRAVASIALPGSGQFMGGNKAKGLLQLGTEALFLTAFFFAPKMAKPLAKHAPKVLKNANPKIIDILAMPAIRAASVVALVNNHLNSSADAGLSPSKN